VTFVGFEVEVAIFFEGRGETQLALEQRRMILKGVADLINVDVEIRPSMHSSNQVEQSSG